MEVDMLLNDLPTAGPKVQPRHNSFSTLPSKVYPKSFPRGNALQSLQAEEKVLEGQLSTLTNKREKLAGELEGLISQVGGVSWLSCDLCLRYSGLPLIRPPLGPIKCNHDNLSCDAGCHMTNGVYHVICRCRTSTHSQ